jgi:hypothetical protein
MVVPCLMALLHHPCVIINAVFPFLHLELDSTQFLSRLIGFCYGDLFTPVGPILDLLSLTIMFFHFWSLFCLFAPDMLL